MENFITNKELTTKFIEKSIKIHGNKYDYSLVDYIDNKTKIKIICSIHGCFEQTPGIHLRGSGGRHHFEIIDRWGDQEIYSSIVRELTPYLSFSTETNIS